MKLFEMSIFEEYTKKKKVKFRLRSRPRPRFQRSLISFNGLALSGLSGISPQIEL